MINRLLRLLPSLLLLASACATTAEQAPRRMLDLNREALAAQQAGDLDRARQLLLDAVMVGQDAGLSQHQTMALAYLQLGAVHLAQNDRTRALRHLRLAVRIDPQIEPPPEIATPELAGALSSARAHARRRRAIEEGAREAPAAPATAAPAPARPAAEEDPELPDPVPEPLWCDAPDEVPTATELTVRCALGQGLEARRVVLHYRARGREEFTPVTMTRSPKGWYRGTIPAASVTGSSIQYYVEAQGDGRDLASSGSLGSPHLVLVGAGRSGGVDAVDEEDPIDDLEREHERTTAGVRRRGARTPFLGAGLGSAFGYHGRRVLERRSEFAAEPRFGSAGLVHVLPELGWQLDARWAVALQGRHQIILASGSGDDQPGGPERSAHAVLLRLYRFWGEGRLQPFVTGSVGGGEGFRLIVPPTPASGLPRNDTIRGGPVVLGPGGGFAYHFGRHFAWVLEARLLVGVPDFAALGELDTGAQISF